jgi:hypothetical protein
MKGFDDRFADLPDYILRITEEIWEGRGIASLRRYYGESIPMRLPGGLSLGNEATIDGTLATLAEFPDRELLGEDVIWSGDEEAGFLSSHRLVTQGTHTGHGLFGPPTGRAFTIRAIADCFCAENRITDEWLVRDSGGIAVQLGLEPSDVARAAVARGARPFTPEHDVPGPYAGRGNDSEWGARLASILTAMMDKDFAVVGREYDRAVRTEHPCARGGWGRAFAETEWMRLRAAFPRAEFQVHHIIGREDPRQPPRAAVRWSLTGTHGGFGRWGEPTGAPVHVMGITHAEWGPWGLRREFTLWDEVAVWAQIHLGAAA